MATWEVLSRTKDKHGETTTWLVDFRKPQEQMSAHDDEQDQDDDARVHERRQR